MSQWFPPEPGPANLPGVLAKGLVTRGHRVSVLTGFPNYPSGEIFPEFKQRRRTDYVEANVCVRRVALYPSHDASSLRRTANYASFAVSAAVSGLNILRDVDVLWVNYSPITIALPMWLNKVRHRTPTVIHVLDLWPDTMSASGFAHRGLSSGIAQRTLSAWCSAMYSTASVVAYISPGVGEVLSKRGVPKHKLHYAPMWADETIFYPTAEPIRSELGLGPDDIALLYAGTMGTAQGLETLIDACSLVRSPKFRCLIAGSGVEEVELRARARGLADQRVRFLGRYGADRMSALLSTADLSFVGLRDHPLSRITLPSKIQATMAAGCPIVAALSGDAAELIRESRAGWVSPPSDPRALAQLIDSACDVGRTELAKIGALGRDFYSTHFAAGIGVKRIERLLETALGMARS